LLNAFILIAVTKLNMSGITSCWCWNV